MATAPGPAIRPTWELVELALASEGNAQPLAPAIGISALLDTNRPSSASKPELDDASSDVTLVDEPVMTPDSETDENQKEITPSTEMANELTTQDPIPNGSRADSMEVELEGASAAPSHPNRAPPKIPPRPTEQKITEDRLMQQDVYEVIGKVLNKVQCAIRADGIDSNQNRMTEVRKYVALWLSLV